MVYSTVKTHNNTNTNNNQNIGGTLMNAPLSKGSNSSGGDVVIGMAPPQKF